MAETANKKLYVGNLNFGTKEEELHELFSPYGNVTNIKIIRDAYTQRSRGFAFIEMELPEAAGKAREALNGYSFQERKLTIDWAKDERKDRQPRRPQGRAPRGRGFENRGNRGFGR